MYSYLLVSLLAAFFVSLINYNIKRKKFEKELLNIICENTQHWRNFSSSLPTFLKESNSGINANEQIKTHEELISLLLKNILLKNEPPFTIEVSYGLSKRSTISAYLTNADDKYLIENMAYKNYSTDYTLNNLNIRMIA